MSGSPTPAPEAFGTPAWLRRRPAAIQGLAVVSGILMLTVSSWGSIPMVPVPMTLQTLAVLLIGAMYGWRLGSLTVLTWLALGALGLPVFAGGAGGVARLLGPTGGYLVAFPVAAALTGWLAERGWNGGRPALALAAMVVGHALCLLVGGAWLATTVGVHKAVAVGVLPFLPGAAIKSGLGALVLMAVGSLVRRRSPIQGSARPPNH